MTAMALQPNFDWAKFTCGLAMDGQCGFAASAAS
jgi:hypothetical protein